MWWGSPSVPMGGEGQGRERGVTHTSAVWGGGSLAFTQNSWFCFCIFNVEFYFLALINLIYNILVS